MHEINRKVIFILGGARSGKSTFAQELALKLGGKVLYCATAQPLDDEMRLRIQVHKNSRPADWDTIELIRDTGIALEKIAHNYTTVIIDCITVLVSNLMSNITTLAQSPDIGENNLSLTQADQAVNNEIVGLINCFEKTNSNYIIVSNEVGGGIVPDNELARAYRDTLGKANQQLAKSADEVYFMIAGLFSKIK